MRPNLIAIVSGQCEAMQPLQEQNVLDHLQLYLLEANAAGLHTPVKTFSIIAMGRQSWARARSNILAIAIFSGLFERCGTLTTARWWSGAGLSSAVQTGPLIWVSYES